MPDIPVRPLCEVTEQVTTKIATGKDSEKPYVGLEHLEPGSPHLTGTAPSSASVSANTVFEAGDTLFGKLRPYLRKSVIAPFEGYCSTDILVLRAIEGAHPRFVGHLLRSEDVFAAAVRSSIGTRMPRTSWKALRNVEVYAPRAEEQRQIAEILDALDEAIRKTETIIAKLKQVKQGLLHDLLTRGIDENGELRDPERYPEQFKDSPLGRIPKEWEVERLAQVYAERSKNGLYKPAKFHGRGPLMVQMGNIFRGMEASFDGAGRVDVSPSELSNYGLRNGDLLFARRSLVLEGAGKCAIVRDLPEDSTFESSIVRVRVDEDRVVPLFAALYLSSASAYRDRRRFIRQVAVSGVSSADIAQFWFLKPPVDEQHEICSRVDRLDARIGDERHEKDKLRLLMSGLMEDLLTGRVRVTNLLEEAAE